MFNGSLNAKKMIFSSVLRNQKTLTLFLHEMCSSMDSEMTLTKQIASQLVELGYKELSIQTNVILPTGKEVDLLVVENGQPRAVIDFKVGRSFPESLDAAELRFHPAVRAVQRLSKEAGTPYYALANKERLLWFETDDVGRPRLLNSPVLPEAQDRNAEQLLLGITKESVSRAIFHLLDLGRRTSDPYQVTLHASIAIYAYVLSKKHNDSSLKRALSHPSEDLNTLRAFEEEIHLEEALDKAGDFFFQAFGILDQANFLDIQTNDLLSAFDEFLLLRNQFYGFKLPRWLNDLFIQLADIGKKDRLLEIFSNFGDIAAITALSCKQTRVISIVNHPINYLWTKIQQLILEANDQNQVLFGEFPPIDLINHSSLINISKVIVTPPFNARVDLELVSKQL